MLLPGELALLTEFMFVPFFLLFHQFFRRCQILLWRLRILVPTVVGPFLGMFLLVLFVLFRALLAAVSFLVVIVLCDEIK